MRKSRIPLIISNLMGDKQLLKLSLMHNSIANFIKLLDISKEFAENRVNELRNLVQVRAMRCTMRFNTFERAPAWRSHTSEQVWSIGISYNSLNYPIEILKGTTGMRTSLNQKARRGHRREIYIISAALGRTLAQTRMALTGTESRAVSPKKSRNVP